MKDKKRSREHRDPNPQTAKQQHLIQNQRVNSEKRHFQSLQNVFKLKMLEVLVQDNLASHQFVISEMLIEL